MPKFGINFVSIGGTLFVDCIEMLGGIIIWGTVCAKSVIFSFYIIILVYKLVTYYIIIVSR